MAYFQTKNPYFGKIRMALQWKMVVYFRPFGLFFGHLVCFAAIVYMYFIVILYFLRFGMLYQEKSGNPDRRPWKTNIKATTVSMFLVGARDLEVNHVRGRSLTRVKVGNLKSLKFASSQLHGFLNGKIPS
jgi:hypothetical protein